ncbi:MAG: sigma-70 family RNA polymerase sigma factor [Burkholderiaceae bacterium]
MAVHYYRELLNFCARSLKDRDAAADLVQEAYARFLALGRSGETVADPRALLYRTARNLLIDQRRRRDVRADEQSLEALADEAQPALPRHQQPEAIYAFSQYARAIHDAIESLPPRCREAFILNRFDGLSHQQVADRMGISRNMVAQHVIRAVLVCKAFHAAFHGDAGASAADRKGGPVEESSR